MSGAVCGLIAWGGVRVELRWLRADLKSQGARIERLENFLLRHRRVGDRISNED